MASSVAQESFESALSTSFVPGGRRSTRRQALIKR
jgi:hypothetical protein